MTRSFSLATLGRASLAIVLFLSPATRAQQAGGQEGVAADVAPSAFGHLPRRDGGPTWTIDSIADTLAPGATLVLEPGKPIPPVKDVQAAMRTAIVALRSADTGRHELAFRLVGAAENQTHDVNAIKLFALLQHHGIGTKADAGAAIRTALDAVRAGDREAAEFVARDSPKSFASIAKAVTSIKKLTALPSPSLVKLSAPILTIEPEKVTVGANGDKPLTLDLTTVIEKLKVGRVVTVAGIWEGGSLAALVGEVPEPAFDYKWDFVRRAVRRGQWRLQTIRVTVTNKGIQPIKSANVRVVCSIRGGMSRTRVAHCDALAPGASQSLAVNFDMYSFDYGDSGMPEAQVTFEDVEW